MVQALNLHKIRSVWL